jgi:hypothetical protein
MATQNPAPPAPAAATLEPETQTAQPANHIENVNNISSDAHSEDDAPTDSHALAHADLEVKGLVHKSPDTDATTDIGWTQQPQEFDEPIVGGISNDDLWMLIRRFNKVCNALRSWPCSDVSI